MDMRQQHVPPRPLPAQSSVIRDIAYEADNGELRLTFVSGRQYAYADVPVAIYEAFLASSSKGAFFNIAIRGRFHFHEIIPEDQPVWH